MPEEPDATSPTQDELTPPSHLPPRYAFAIGERVTGPGVNGEVIDRPGPWSVTVIQQPGGVRLTASTLGLTRAG